MAGVSEARSPDAWTGGARPDSRFQSRRGRGRQSLKRRGTPPARQREGAGQPALLHTNCGSTAQGAHARAQSEVWRSGAPGGVERRSASAGNVDAMAEIVNVDAFEDAGDDDAPVETTDADEGKTESKLEGRWGSSGWDERKSDYESHARPEPINQRVKSLLRGSGSWRQGTQRNLPGIKDKGLLNDSFFSNAEDVLFDKDPGGYDSEESVEEVFEAIEGIYCPPLTLKEHEWYCTHVLNLHKETKSSWDELFFDLALVAAFGSLASCLTLSSESDVHHRRLSSSDVHMSFPRAVFLYCLETATVISVRRFTDGHRAQWRRNDLFGSLLLLGRAICCLGMGGPRPASFFTHARNHAASTP